MTSGQCLQKTQFLNCSRFSLWLAEQKIVGMALRPRMLWPTNHVLRASVLCWVFLGFACDTAVTTATATPQRRRQLRGLLILEASAAMLTQLTNRSRLRVEDAIEVAESKCVI